MLVFVSYETTNLTKGPITLNSQARQPHQRIKTKAEGILLLN